jgi:4-hydroxy-tetrahydrodipicolinate synthase
MQDAVLRGVYVPLVTPCFRGSFDRASLRRLIRHTQPSVSGYVPCLSSGEGSIVPDELWGEVVAATRAATRKTLIAGIKRSSIDDVIALAHRARRIGCNAVMIPVPYADETKTLRYFATLARQIALPIAVYNTEQNQIRTLRGIGKLQDIDKIIGIKDSSMNEKLFASMCAMRVSGKLRLSVLQGMEHQMRVPRGCDGHIVALANVEPALCKDMFERNSAALAKRIADLFWKYNLGGNWYVSLKAILRERGIIRSAEEAVVAVRP